MKHSGARLESVALCFLMCVANSAQAQNWPSFRGKNASGIADVQALPTTWDVEKSSNILWKTPIPGLGHSSPVVWGDRVFVTTAISGASKTAYNPKNDDIEPADDLSNHQWRVFCLDKRTGKIIWAQTACEGPPKVKRHVKATQANPTPATDGRVVVVSFGSEGLYCYDLDGKLIWKQDLGILNPGYAGQPDLSWGYASSPVLYQGLAIVQCDIQKDSFIAAFDVKDGRRVWMTPRDELPSWSTPVVYEGKSRPELVTSGSKYYRGYDPLTGRELWRLLDDCQVKVPSPVIANDLFYLSGGNPRGREFYVVRPNATGDISLPKDQDSSKSIAWRKRNGSPYTPTPIVYGGYLYICNDNGVLTVYDANSGRQAYIHRIGTKGSTFSASPIAAAGKLYFASEDGEVFVVRAGPAYELLATNQMGEALMATPAVSDGIILIRGQQTVFAVKQEAR
jgi:outer membrane protein assembly factor BamB